MIRRNGAVTIIAVLACVMLDLVPFAARGQPAVAPILEGYLSEASGDTEGALAAFQKAVRLDPESARARILAAHVLASDGRLQEALELIDGGLKMRPGHPELLLWRARLLEALGKREEATEAAKQAALAGSAQAYPLAIHLLEASGQTQPAADLAETWAEKFPNSPEPWFARAQLLVRLGRKAKARSAFEKALQLAPDHIPSLRSLAELQEQAGNNDAAEALYRKVLRLNPHDIDARFRLGQILVEEKRLDEVIDLFKDLERWNGNDRSASLRFGMLLLAGEKPADAEAVFRKLTDEKPDDATAWYLLGVSLQAQEKYQPALDAYGRVPASASEYSDALVRRALALADLKRAGEGLALLRGWLKDHPDDEEVTMALSEFLEDQGDVRAAADELEAYVGRSQTKNSRIFFSLGVLYDKLKDWQKSADYIKRSLQLNPDDPQALNYLGYTYADRGVHLEEAEKLIRRALELKPHDGAIIDSLGWVYYRQGRFPEAAAQLRKALDVMPKDPVIWEHLGDALKALGDVPGARKAYRNAVGFDPNAASAKQKLEELR